MIYFFIFLTLIFLWAITTIVFYRVLNLSKENTIIYSIIVFGILHSIFLFAFHKL